MAVVTFFSQGDILHTQYSPVDVLSFGRNHLAVTLPVSLPLKDVSYYASNQE